MRVKGYGYSSKSNKAEKPGYRSMVTIASGCVANVRLSLSLIFHFLPWLSFLFLRRIVIRYFAVVMMLSSFPLRYKVVDRPCLFSVYICAALPASPVCLRQRSHR